MKKLSVLFAASLLAATPALADDNGKTAAPAPFNCDFAPACEVAPGIYGNLQAPTTSKFNLTVGGFVKLDYAYNSLNLGSAYSQMAPQAVAKTSSLANQRDQSTFSARQSRLWFKSNGPTLLGAKTTGLLEFDFQDVSNTANSDFINASPRLRHGYANLDWGTTQVLFGQTDSLFGLAGGATIDFRSAGGSGFFIGARNPQLRLTQRVDLSKDNSIKLALAVESPVQDNNALTANAGKPGTASGTAGTAANGDTWGATPNVTAQALFVSKALGVASGGYGFSQKSLTAGFFGLYGKQEVQGNAKSVDSWGVGFYTFVPIIKSTDGKSRAGTVAFEGQIYKADNIVTVGGTGATAASLVGTPGNLTGAKGYGIASELYYYPIQALGLTAGYGKRAALDLDSYKNNPNFEKYNETFFINAAFDLNAAVRVAAEYEHLKTKYGNVVSNTTAGSSLAGLSDHGQANIGRLALYYFF